MDFDCGNIKEDKELLDMGCVYGLDRSGTADCESFRRVERVERECSLYLYYYYIYIFIGNIFFRL